MIVVFIISFIPVIFWFTMESLGVRFSSLNSAMTSFGQIFGLVGTAMFATTLILAGRLKVLDKYFRGLDKVYLRHHNLGAMSFILILFHPLLLAVKYFSISAKSALEFLLPSTKIAPNTGIVALVMMSALIIATFYIKFKYHQWKLSHKFMTIVFAIAIVHTVLANSDVSRNLALEIYMLVLSAAGIIISVRQAFLSKWLVKKYVYSVKSLSKLNDDVYEICMTPKSKKMNFRPGQFAFFGINNKSLSSESHPFSFASDSDETDLTIIAKNLGDYTSELFKIKVGDEVLADGPYGNFSQSQLASRRQIWIAGGIGITPFFSMAKNIKADHKITMYYSVKDAKEAVKLDWLTDLAKRNQSFQFNLWDAGKQGFITAKTIFEQVGDITNTDIYLCGPSGFMKSLSKQFSRLGVKRNNIHFERFDL